MAYRGNVPRQGGFRDCPASRAASSPGISNRWPATSVIIKANADASTRAVLFHRGNYIPQGVPDTFGFNGMDAAQTTGDTVALAYPSAVGIGTTLKFRQNGAVSRRCRRGRYRLVVSRTGRRRRCRC
jgi:hypothetical protein